MRRRRRTISLEAGPTAAILGAVMAMDLSATVAVAVLLKRLTAVVARPAEKVGEVAHAIVQSD